MTVGGTAYPPDPVFETASEELVWSRLRGQLRDGDVMLHGVRFSDPRSGDVEADILLLLPDLGAVVIEVKGGQVTFSDGEWRAAYAGISRRIHPIAQARRAKHAVRRFLDRQRAWPFGYLRTEWMVAFPYTAVDGDLGPEGRRDLILGRDDLDTMMERILHVMRLPASDPPVPDVPWVDQAVSLLRSGDNGGTFDDSPRAQGGPGPGRTRRWAAGIGAVALLAAVTGGVTWSRSEPDMAPGVTPSGACHPAYDTCVDPMTQADCPDIGHQVIVIDPAVDPLDLDADNDGVGCESYPS